MDERDMPVSELRKKIEANHKAGWKDHLAEVELSKRFSIPLSCILFGIIGVPLGITSRRSGKSGGFVFAILIILLYYVSLVLLQNFGRSGIINPYFSVWIPNIVLLVVAIYVGYKTQKEIPFRTFNKAKERIILLGEYLLEKFGYTETYSETSNNSRNPD